MAKTHLKLFHGFAQQIWFLARRTFSKSSDDRISSMSASLAYYAVFCTAPLLVIAVSALILPAARKISSIACALAAIRFHRATRTSHADGGC